MYRTTCRSSCRCKTVVAVALVFCLGMTQTSLPASAQAVQDTASREDGRPRAEPVGDALGTSTVASKGTGLTVAAAETFRMVDAPDYGVRSGLYQTDLQWFETASGSTAYCLDKGRRFQNGSVYGVNWDPRVGYWMILLNGYPCNTSMNKVALSADEARAATQYALWAFKIDETAGIQVDLGSCYAVTDQGSRVLAAARWLVWKALSNPYYRMFAAPEEVAAYIGLARMQGVSDGSISPDGRSLVFGPFRLDSEVATAAVSLKIEGLPGWFFSEADGTPMNSPQANRYFHIAVPRVGMPADGIANISVVSDYMNLAALIWGEPSQTMQDMGVVYNPHPVRDIATYPVSWASDTVTKLDADSLEPLAGATFKLSREVTGSWQEIESLTSDGDGKVVFGALAPGNYRVQEICPPVTHADAWEGGSEAEQLFTITENSTGEAQVFKDEAIRISCSVDKSTIALTSAAFSALPGQGGTHNVGKETYAYRIGYANTANVRGDEFTVDDPLENVSQGLVRVRELWTPVSIGDSDGLMNIWYRTDRTDASTLYDTASAMDTNPYNPHNSENRPQISNTGWKLWMQDADCAKRSHLDTAELRLEVDEHITALRFEHGSVEEGFQTTEEATYLVYAARDLSPYSKEGEETVIESSVTARIFRNQILSDEAEDTVQTRVIDTFAFPRGANASGGTPRTGDALDLGMVIVAGGAASAGILLVALSYLRRRRTTVSPGEDGPSDHSQDRRQRPMPHPRLR